MGEWHDGGALAASIPRSAARRRECTHSASLTGRWVRMQSRWVVGLGAGGPAWHPKNQGTRSDDKVGDKSGGRGVTGCASARRRETGTGTVARLASPAAGGAESQAGGIRSKAPGSREGLKGVAAPADEGWLPCSYSLSARQGWPRQGGSETDFEACDLERRKRMKGKRRSKGVTPSGQAGSNWACE